MHRRQHQHGMTAIGWLLVLGLIAFFTLLTLRLLPLYLEYAKVDSAIESLGNQPGITEMGKTEIVKLLRKRFDINDVNNVDPADIKLAKDKGITTISIDYERREHLMSNIDVVASFTKKIEVVSR